VAHAARGPSISGWRRKGPAADSRGEAMRVLVVDDDSDVTSAICLVLEACGHRAEAVHRADEVITAVQRFTPQAVLLDIGLPDRSGYEVAAELQALEDRNRLRVIALSGSEEGHSQKRLFDLWLLKPVSSRDLLQSLVAHQQSWDEASDPRR